MNAAVLRFLLVQLGRVFLPLQSYACARIRDSGLVADGLRQALEQAHTKSTIVADFADQAGAVTSEGVSLADRLCIS